MFGWFAIILTGYAKSHGLIPNPEVALDLKQWGTLSILAGPQTISNEVSHQLAAVQVYTCVRLLMYVYA
jgi:hypothetical protein